MKKNFFALLIIPAVLFTVEKTYSQQIKIGVFDIEYMVRAMPGYASVDSLVQIYDRDSLGAQYDNYLNKYKNLDSIYKADSLRATTDAKFKTQWDSTAAQRQQIALYLINWQQIAQYNEENKRRQLAAPLYQQVADAYKKVLAAKKYNLIFKPLAYEIGSNVDNLFISVAKELKLTSLPQELLQLGPDPDAGQTGANPPKTNVPKTNSTTTNKKP